MQSLMFTSHLSPARLILDLELIWLSFRDKFYLILYLLDHELTWESWQTDTGELPHPVLTSSVVLAGWWLTLVHLQLTQVSSPPRHAHTLKRRDLQNHTVLYLFISYNLLQTLPYTLYSIHYIYNDYKIHLILFLTKKKTLTRSLHSRAFTQGLEAHSLMFVSHRLPV